MNDRSTKTITTTNGHEVVLLDYITGFESRAIKSVYLNEMEVTQKGTKEPETGFSGSLATEAEDKAISTVVKSIDGKTEDIVNLVLGLREEDYMDIIKAINEITNPKKKSQDGSSTTQPAVN